MARPPTDTGGGFPRAASLIADPSTIGWVMVAGFSVIALADQTLGIGARWDRSNAWWNSVGVIISLAVTFALLWLAKVGYLRRSFSRRHVSVMVVTMFTCVMTGTVVGRTTTTALASSGDAAPSPIGLDRMLSGTVVLVIIGWGLGALQAYRSTLRFLQSTESQLTVATAASEDALRAEHDNVKAPIVATLCHLLESIPNLSAAEAAQRIREVAETVVRPVSHQLMATTTPVDLPTPASPPRPSWRLTLSQVAGTPLLLPKVMAVTMALFVGRLSINEASGTPSIPRSADVAVTVDMSSLARALGQLFVVFLAVWLTAAVASRSMRSFLPTRTIAVRWLILLGSVPVVAVVAQATIIALFAIPGFSPDTHSALGNPLTFIVPLMSIAVFAGMIRTVRMRGSDILRQLRDANSDLAFELARLNEALWMQRRSLSRTLHGPVQGTLNSAALLLDHTPEAQVGDPTYTDVVGRLERAIAALENGMSDQIDVADELALIDANWQGIIEVLVDVSAHTLRRVQADPLCAASFVDIVGEATANAVIHGGAKRIAFHVMEQGPRQVRIEAVDDGTGVELRNGGGLGSQLLQEACTEWGLSSHDDHTHLFAVVPLTGLITPSTGTLPRERSEVT